MRRIKGLFGLMAAMTMMAVLIGSAFAEEDGIQDRATERQQKMELQEARQEALRAKQAELQAERVAKAAELEAAKAERQAEREAKVLERCDRVATRIAEKLSRYEENQNRHASTYNRMTIRLSELLDRLEEKTVDVSTVRALVAEFDALNTSAQLSLAAAMSGLEASQSYACGQSEGDFKAALQGARDLFGQVRERTAAVRSYYHDTLKPAILAFRESLAASRPVEKSL